MNCDTPACYAHASWVRQTQFEGAHHYCDEHAKKEENFGRADIYGMITGAYYFWETIDEFNKRQQAIADLRKKPFKFSDEFYKKAIEIEKALPPDGLIAAIPELYEKLEADVAQQTVVIRKDLNMRKGKIAAQAAMRS